MFKKVSPELFLPKYQEDVKTSCTPPGLPPATTGNVVQYFDEVVFTLRNGMVASIKQPGPDDMPGLQSLYGGASDEARRFRFLSPTPARRAARNALMQTNLYSPTIKDLIVVAGDDIVGHGLAAEDPDEPGVDEVGFLTADHITRQGVCLKMAEELFKLAEIDDRNIRALVHPQNTPMLSLFAKIADDKCPGMSRWYEASHRASREAMATEIRFHRLTTPNEIPGAGSRSLAEYCLSATAQAA